MSCHAGTHVDAPSHFDPDGETADAIPLAHCIGPCVVTTLERLAEARDAERVLVKAGGAAPTVAQIAQLVALKLFGTDGHSVDPLDSKTLDAHHALRRKGAVILEELLLDEVAEGDYELIALPIKLAGMDGAPVRAVLIAR
jgi:arylformamidase